MPRKPRQLIDHGCYHLIARGNNRQPILGQEEAFRDFLHELKLAKERYPSKIYHYCLMSNHVHLLVEIERGDYLPKFMQRVLQGYGRRYQKRTGYIGHVWQGRYKSPFVDKESYFLEAGRYIERNPLRAKIVDDLSDYRWSSYLYYAYGRHDSLVEEDPYYCRLDPDLSKRQEQYRDFVRLRSPYDTVLDQEFLEKPF